MRGSGDNSSRHPVGPDHTSGSPIRTIFAAKTLSRRFPPDLFINIWSLEALHAAYTNELEVSGTEVAQHSVGLRFARSRAGWLSSGRCTVWR